MERLVVRRRVGDTWPVREDEKGVEDDQGRHRPGHVAGDDVDAPRRHEEPAHQPRWEADGTPGNPPSLRRGETRVPSPVKDAEDEKKRGVYEGGHPQSHGEQPPEQRTIKPEMHEETGDDYKLQHHEDEQRDVGETALD